jgi:hypothetical protein
LFTTLYANFLAELLVIPRAKAANWGSMDGKELTSRIIIVEDKIGGIFLIAAFAVAAFYNMDAIVFTIK